MDLLIDPWSAEMREWALVPLRVALGAVFIDAGLGKWRRGIGSTGEWFAELGIPFAQVQARLVAAVELVGGALLLVGLFAHWAAIPLAATMLVAVYVSKFKLGHPFQGGSVQGYELDVILLAAAVAVALGGAGPLSVDAFLS
ncbi:MAG: DoxX family protein [Chloroflexi bacterium]|nr:DoxX family protein [Chloroflexota bacterium]